LDVDETSGLAAAFNAVVIAEKQEKEVEEI